MKLLKYTEKVKKYSRKKYYTHLSPAVKGVEQAHWAAFTFWRAGINQRTYDNLNKTAARSIYDNGKYDACIRSHNERENTQTQKSDACKNMGCDNADTVADFLNEIGW